MFALQIPFCKVSYLLSLKALDEDFEVRSVDIRKAFSAEKCELTGNGLMLFE